MTNGLRNALARLFHSSLSPRFSSTLARSFRSLHRRDLAAVKPTGYLARAMATPKGRIASLLAARPAPAPRPAFTPARFLSTPSWTSSFLPRPQAPGQRPTAARLLHSDSFARSSPIASTSSLPRAYLAARIRSRSASTEAKKEVEPVQKESEVVVEKEEGDKGSSKIKLGEVRRLMVLAKPEQKTIALAIGLVSTRCCTLAEMNRSRACCAAGSSLSRLRSPSPSPSPLDASSICSREVLQVYRSRSLPLPLYSPSSSRSAPLPVSSASPRSPSLRS